MKSVTASMIKVSILYHLNTLLYKYTSSRQNILFLYALKRVCYTVEEL